MKNKLLKASCILVYIFFVYLFGWQIYYFNQEVLYSKELKDVYSNFYKYMPALVLLLFGILLYANTLLKQRRIIIFNSIFAASLLYFYQNLSSLIIGILLLAFGLVIAFIEVAGEKLSK